MLLEERAPQGDQLIPSVADWQKAKAVHKRFSKFFGAQHIATPFALAHLAAILRKCKISSILEIGAGIGTITYLLLTHDSKQRQIICAENNEFCIQQINHNIPEELIGGLQLITDYRELCALEQSFDLIIFDGVLECPDQYRILSEGAICFVEGSRKETRQEINAYLKLHGLKCLFSNYHQGKRLLPIEWRRTSSGLPYPRLKFRRKIKGFWIGRIDKLTT